MSAPLLRLPFSVVVAVDSAILMVPLGGSSSHHHQNPTTTTTTTTLPLTVWEIPQQQQQPTSEDGQQQQQPCPPPLPLLLPNNSSTSPPVFYSELDRAWHPYPESYRVQLHIPNMKDVYFAIRHSDSNNNNNNNKLFQMSWCESKTSAPPQYSVVSGKSPTEVWTTFLLRVHHRLTADVRVKLPRSGLEAVGLTNATVLRALGHKKQQHNNKSSAATTTATIAGVVTMGDAKTNLQAMTTTTAAAAADGVVQQKPFRIRDAFPAPAHDDWGAIRRLANTIAADDRAVELATEMARKAQAEKKAAAERARERAIRAILLEYDNGTMISSPSMTSMDDDEDDDVAAGLDVRLMRRARRDAGKSVGESSPKLLSRGGGGGGRGRKQKAQASKRPLFPLKESRVGSDYQVNLCGGGGMRMRDPMDMGGTPLLLPDDEEFLHWKDTEELLVVNRNRSRNKKRKAAGGGGGGGGFTAAATAKLARRQELVIAQAAAAVTKVRETTMPPFPASSFFNAYLTLLQQPEDKVYSSWLAERVGDFAKYCGMPGVRTDGRKKVRKLAEFCA